MKGIIALDLDGTLLNKEQKVSDGNREAIQYAISKGYEIMISTGRALANVNVKMFEELGIRYILHLNGARVVDLKTNKVIFSAALNRATAYEIFKKLPKEDTYKALYVNERAIVSNDDKEVIYRLGFPEVNIISFNNSVDYVDDPIEYANSLNEEIYKVSIDLVKGDNYRENRSTTEQMIKGYADVNCVSGGFEILEFTTKNVSKGLTLGKVVEYLGLDIKDCMAIGDSENDLDIIKAAGFGVAMGNAEGIVKDNADYITDDCLNDGVAKAIYHFVK